MRQRVLSAIAALLCVLTLFATGVAPAYAYVPPSGEGDTSVQVYEEVCWYYRTRVDGVKEKRLWSITRGIWLTDWIVCP